jgi:hypothetical protein
VCERQRRHEVSAFRCRERTVANPDRERGLNDRRRLDVAPPSMHAGAALPVVPASSARASMRTTVDVPSNTATQAREGPRGRPRRGGGHRPRRRDHARGRHPHRPAGERLQRVPVGAADKSVGDQKGVAARHRRGRRRHGEHGLSAVVGGEDGPDPGGPARLDTAAVPETGMLPPVTVKDTSRPPVRSAAAPRRRRWTRTRTCSTTTWTAS